MLVSPIIERELRVALRKHGAVKSRFKTAAGGAAVVCVFLLIGLLAGSSHIGRSLHTFLFFGGLYMAIIPPARICVGLFCEERRNQTLELLYLTGMGSVELFLGKLLGGVLIASSDLLALTPFLAIPFFSGGVSLNLFLATIGCFPVVLLFTVAIGVLGSVLCRDGRSAGLRDALGRADLPYGAVAVFPRESRRWLGAVFGALALPESGLWSISGGNKFRREHTEGFLDCGGSDRAVGVGVYGSCRNMLEPELAAGDCAERGGWGLAGKVGNLGAWFGGLARRFAETVAAPKRVSMAGTTGPASGAFGVGVDRRGGAAVAPGLVGVAAALAFAGEFLSDGFAAPYGHGCDHDLRGGATAGAGAKGRFAGIVADNAVAAGRNVAGANGGAAGAIPAGGPRFAGPVCPHDGGRLFDAQLDDAGVHFIYADLGISADLDFASASRRAEYCAGDVDWTEHGPSNSRGAALAARWPAQSLVVDLDGVQFAKHLQRCDAGGQFSQRLLCGSIRDRIVFFALSDFHHCAGVQTCTAAAAGPVDNGDAIDRAVAAAGAE